MHQNWFFVQVQCIARSFPAPNSVESIEYAIFKQQIDVINGVTKSKAIYKPKVTIYYLKTRKLLDYNDFIYIQKLNNAINSKNGPNEKPKTEETIMPKKKRNIKMNINMK